MIKKNQFYILLTTIVFGLIVTIHVANGIRIRNIIKNIDQKTQEFEVLLNENKELRTEYEALIARERIVSIASKEMGMVFPTESPIILQIEGKKLRGLEAN